MDTFKIKFLLIVALVYCSEVSAQEQEDDNGAFEFWSRMNIRWTTKKSTQHDFEFQYRNQQRVASLQERFQLYTFRWYIMKRWDNFFTQSSPVTFFERRTAEGTLVNEYRVTQNVGWFFLKDDLQVRTGIEGRFFWSEGDHFEEIRTRTRLQYFVPINDNFRFVVADEVFFHKRLTGSEVPAFDQNRISIGMSYKFSKHLVVDTGYQFHNRSFVESETDNFNIVYFYLTYQL